MLDLERPACRRCCWQRLWPLPRRSPRRRALLTGRVTDTTGRPARRGAGARVEAGRATTTDLEGRYTLAEAARRAPTACRSRWIGYAPVVRRVTIGAEGTPPSTSPCARRLVELPEVQVTASAARHHRADVAAADQRPGRRRPARGPGAIARRDHQRAPGVHSISDGPAIGKPVIRGLSLEPGAGAGRRPADRDPAVGRRAGAEGRDRRRRADRGDPRARRACSTAPMRSAAS